MAGPTAHDASEESGDEEGGGEEEHAGVDLADFERAHRVGEDESPDGPAGDPPVEDVRGDEEVNGDEDAGAPPADVGVATLGGTALSWAERRGGVRGGGVEDGEVDGAARGWGASEPESRAERGCTHARSGVADGCKGTLRRAWEQARSPVREDWGREKGRRPWGSRGMERGSQHSWKKAERKSKKSCELVPPSWLKSAVLSKKSVRKSKQSWGLRRWSLFQSARQTAERES